MNTLPTATATATATDIIEWIRIRVPNGTAIYETKNHVKYRTKCWGMRRGETAFVYLIPSRTPCRLPYEKGVTVTEIRMAYYQLVNVGRFNSMWFKERLIACHAEGACNFHAIGGLFVVLGEASRSGSCYYSTNR